MLKFRKCRDGFSITRKVKDNITQQPLIRYFADVQVVRIFKGAATYDFRIPFLRTAYED